MRPRPIVYCFVAYVYADGCVWGAIHRVRLETAAWMKEAGYAVVGPDPEDMQDLAQWEREQGSIR